MLQSTLQRVNVPSFIGDADGRILWLNDAAKDAFGDRTGASYTTVVAPEYAERVAAEIKRMRNGATGSDYEIDVILHDGGAGASRLAPYRSKVMPSSTVFLASFCARVLALWRLPSRP